ncbi:ATP-binding protein [Streptantibioticus ferralitis]|uniref:ATP-binding protein n=1 Tax=Streptantibioticus ferralitis TaxID=236510 RepID=A0ABT5Z8C4_9ACTN|nr:ATP-binding protein [Streptantibioticus ferralitis]MDF2259801.1 ATP-binding protein [Streptantibioticus ferralitis]
MSDSFQPSCFSKHFYPRTRRSVPAAREFARRALRHWNIVSRADDILLCVSELATNALLHGVPPGRGYQVSLGLSGDGVLRVEVDDSGDGDPRIPDTAAEDESGRGLRLVAALADKWGVGERVPGKFVWCEFDLSRRSTYGYGYVPV